MTAWSKRPGVGVAARRASFVLVGAFLALAVAVLPAAAHNTLRSTSPADKQQVARTPAAVVLTFDEPAIALGTHLVVTGPTGEVQAGAARLVDNTVSQDLRPGAAAGAYKVEWRVTSADGHPISGTFGFTSAAAGAATPAASVHPSGEPVPNGAAPIWAPPVIGAVLVLMLGLTSWLRARRSRLRA